MWLSHGGSTPFDRFWEVSTACHAMDPSLKCQAALQELWYCYRQGGIYVLQLCLSTPIKTIRSMTLNVESKDLYFSPLLSLSFSDFTSHIKTGKCIPMPRTLYINITSYCVVLYWIETYKLYRQWERFGGTITLIRRGFAQDPNIWLDMYIYSFKLYYPVDFFSFFFKSQVLGILLKQ